MLENHAERMKGVGMNRKTPKNNTATDWTRMRLTLIKQVNVWHSLHWLVVLHCSDPFCQFCQTMTYSKRPARRLVKSDAAKEHGFHCCRIRVIVKKHQIEVGGRCHACQIDKQVKES